MTKPATQVREVALKLLKFFHQGSPPARRFSHKALILLTQ